MNIRLELTKDGPIVNKTLEEAISLSGTELLDIGLLVVLDVPLDKEYIVSKYIFNNVEIILKEIENDKFIHEIRK